MRMGAAKMINTDTLPSHKIPQISKVRLWVKTTRHKQPASSIVCPGFYSCKTRSIRDDDIPVVYRAHLNPSMPTAKATSI